MITSTFFLKETAALYDNWCTAKLSVFFFADGRSDVRVQHSGDHNIIIYSNCDVHTCVITRLRPWLAATTEANDVILFRSVHRRSKTPKKTPFDGFGEIWPPNCGRTSPWPIKCTSLREIAFSAIVRQNLSMGHFSRRVWGKIKIKKNLVLYFTYLVSRSLTTNWLKFGVTCSSRARNQLCKVLS